MFILKVIPMIIQRLHEFPDRAIEWLLGFIMLSWGVAIISTGESPWWGQLAIFAGFARLAALFVNGAWHRTPTVRVITSFAAMFLWFWVVVDMLKASSIIDLGVYPWFMLGEAFSVYRAGGDAFDAYQRRRFERMAPRASND